MLLIDDHCHLTHKYYSDKLDAVLERARRVGVKAIICSGVNVPTNREVLELAKKYAPLVKCSLGIHPTDAVTFKPEEGSSDYGLSHQNEPIDIDAELEFIRSQRNHIVAVGEVGLDFHHIKDVSLQKKQKEVFEKAIHLAELIKKPLVVHTRSAESECLDILEASKIKNVVLHCFGGNKKTVKRTIDLGYYFSIPAVIERLEHFKMIAELAPLSQLLSETDGPWLTPVPGQQNEPANVLYTVKNIAKVKGTTEEETANAIWMNYQRVFG